MSIYELQRLAYLVIPNDGFVDLIQHMVHNAQESQRSGVTRVQLQHTLVRLLSFFEAAIDRMQGR